MEFRDSYAALGVSPDADEQAIKQAYRKLARQYHPDVNPGNKQAEERFKEIKGWAAEAIRFRERSQYRVREPRQRRRCARMSRCVRRLPRRRGRGAHSRGLSRGDLGSAAGDQGALRPDQSLPPQREHPTGERGFKAVSMFAISTLITFLLASIAIILAPGPAQALVLARTLSDGKKAGILTAVGLSVGTIVHALAAAVGISAILATSA